jgi:hypothetical protein
MATHKNDFGGVIAEGFGEARKKVEEILKSMQAEVANFGLTEAQKKVNELKGLNAKPEDIAKANDYANQLKGLEAYKKKQEEAKKLMEDSLTPVQKYQDGLDKLNDFYREGHIDATAYWAQVAKLNAELGQSLKKMQPNAKVAAETRRFDFAGPKDAHEKQDPMVELKQTAKQQLQEQKQAREYLAEMYRFGLNSDNKATQTTVIDF